MAKEQSKLVKEAKEPEKEKDETSLDGIISSWDSMPEDAIDVVVKDVRVEIFEGDYGRSKRLILDLESRMATPDRPHLARYNYQKWDEAKGVWLPPNRKNQVGMLLSALKICDQYKDGKATGKKGCKMTAGWKDLIGARFTMVFRTVVYEKLGIETTVLLPKIWHQE